MKECKIKSLDCYKILNILTVIQVVLACRLKSISSQIQRHTPPACNVVALLAGANIRDVTVVCYDLYVGALI